MEKEIYVVIESSWSWDNDYGCKVLRGFNDRGKAMEFIKIYSQYSDVISDEIYESRGVRRIEFNDDEYVEYKIETLKIEL